MSNRHKGHIEFCNKAEELTAVPERFFKRVDEQDELFRVPAAVRSKVRWVLTELLINSMKHSGGDGGKLHFELSPEYLKIVRVDNGKPLRIKVNDGLQELEWPLSDFKRNQQFEIYRNGIDSLRVITTSAEIAKFSVEALYEPEISGPLYTSEHFGLMIIAKASDLFNYTFDSKTGSNIFSVTFDYKDEKPGQYQTQI